MKTPHAVYLIDKPEGITSFDVLRKFKSIGIKDVGHGGTLDPFATGLLIVFSGRALKLSEYLLKSEKTYFATLQFGKTTESGDLTNPVTETSPVIPQSLEILQNLANQFCAKPYLQTPPMYSAKKVDGKKLYELARQGKTIEREAVSCKLSDFKFTDYNPSTGSAQFQVTVSSGTFIRTLAQDFAHKLGTVGMLTTLRRLNSGVFSIDRAIQLKDLSRDSPFLTCEELAQKLFPSIITDERTHSMLIRGQQEKLFLNLSQELASVPVEKKHAALFFRDSLSGIIERSESGWKIAKVFTT